MLGTIGHYYVLGLIRHLIFFLILGGKRFAKVLVAGYRRIGKVLAIVYSLLGRVAYVLRGFKIRFAEAEADNVETFGLKLTGLSRHG